MGATMRDLVGRLLIFVVETLDRNLITVPDIDEYDPPFAAHRVMTRTHE
jgi:hypothetical protein